MWQNTKLIKIKGSYCSYHTHTHARTHTPCEFQMASYWICVVSLKTKANLKCVPDKHPYEVSHVKMRQLEKPIFAGNIPDMLDGSLS